MKKKKIKEFLSGRSYKYDEKEVSVPVMELVENDEGKMVNRVKYTFLRRFVLNERRRVKRAFLKESKLQNNPKTKGVILSRRDKKKLKKV